MLQEREDQLAAIQLEADNLLVSKLAELKIVQDKLAEANTGLLEPEIRLKAIAAECEHLETRKTALTDANAALAMAGDQLRQTNTGLEAQNQFLLDQVEPLKGEIQDKTVEKDALTAKIARMQARLDQQQATYKTDEATIAADINHLITQKDELTIWLAEREAEMRAAMKQVGERQLAQDARDDNLRVREAKVNQDQRVIARNARLLEL